MSDTGMPKPAESAEPAKITPKIMPPVKRRYRVRAGHDQLEVEAITPELAQKTFFALLGIIKTKHRVEINEV